MIYATVQCKSIIELKSAFKPVTAHNLVCNCIQNVFILIFLPKNTFYLSMKIAYISTYPPRECGIATFNNNLMHAVSANFPNRKSLLEGGFVVALNDSENIHEYEYPEEVKYIIRQDHQKDYIRAANYINTSTADVCIMEHEFGIYGGESGIYILPLINRLEKPLISILHTILREPS